MVCVIGSSANHNNLEAFLQSDASLAIEPRYPQLCQKVPVSSPPKTGPSPVAISQLLNSVASSLSFRMDDEISIFHLILESRQFTLSMTGAMKFWACSLISLASLQLVSLLLTLPLFLTTGQTLWMTLLIVPLLSLSLLGSKTDPNVMNISTGKNTIIVNGDYARYALWCYGGRFLPALAILILCHLLNVVDLVKTCASGTSIDALGIGPVDDANSTVVSDRYNFTVCSDDVLRDEFLPAALVLPRYFNFLFAFLYFSAISLSFVSRRHQLWQRHPGHCPAWLYVFGVLTLAVALYSVVVLSLVDEAWVSPAPVWVIWGLGLPAVLAVNELVKRQEIKVEVRHQKRERLEFGTKLGMNSPF